MSAEPLTAAQRADDDVMPRKGPVHRIRVRRQISGNNIEARVPDLQPIGVTRHDCNRVPTVEGLGHDLAAGGAGAT